MIYMTQVYTQFHTFVIVHLPTKYQYNPLHILIHVLINHIPSYLYVSLACISYHRRFFQG